MVEIKRRNIKLGRDVILLSEADDEGNSTGIQWMLAHQYQKIDADFALNEGGSILETKDGPKIFEVETTEKIPTHLILTSKGTAADSSMPRADNPITHLNRALLKLSETEQPVKLSPTTRRYLREISRVAEYSWLSPLIRSLDNPNAAIQQAAASQIRAKDPELDAMLRTTVVTTALQAGAKSNVIPNTAVAQVDARRLPNESREDLIARLRQIINDPAVEVALRAGPAGPIARSKLAIDAAISRHGPRHYPHLSARCRGPVHGPRRYRQ